MSVNRMLAVGAVAAIVLSLPFFGRTWNLLMHVLGAIVFMGNIVVSAAWMSLARRARHPEALRLGVRGLTITDAIFTLPGALLVLLNGGIIATPYFQARVGWVMVSLVLFLLSGLVWGVILVPAQKRLSALMTSMPPGGPIPDGADALVSRWFRWGGIATLLPLASLVLMVVKPRIG